MLARTAIAPYAIAESRPPRLKFLPRAVEYVALILSRSPMPRYAPLLTGLLVMSLGAPTSMLSAQRARRVKPPAGVQVSTSANLEIYVESEGTKPYPGGRTLHVVKASVVVLKTAKHGRQRKIERAEAINADLLNPDMWRIGDFDGDGFDDYRVVKEISASGCRTWWTWTYLPDRERFTLASTIAWQTNAAGKPVRSCR
jgi:hypothetical protein